MSTLYDGQFYDDQCGRAASSARVVVPIIQELINPRSVLDVGCGVGAWVSVWIANGVTDVIGIDGDYVNRQSLQIPQDQFIACDLSEPLELGRKFDLVICLEVAEHLPGQSAATLVDSLVRHADVVVFSAAIPGQVGTGHINEQWPSYWVEHFARNGYRPFDLLRSRLWDNAEVDWWYRQNCLIFATNNAANQLKLVAVPGPLEIVHPALLERTLANPNTLSARTSRKARKELRALGRTRVGRILRDAKRVVTG